MKLLNLDVFIRDKRKDLLEDILIEMMNSSTEWINPSLLNAPYQLNIWLGCFLWIMGNIGCVGNILVFRSRKIRKRAYSIYLLASAVADFHYFNFVLLTRILQKGFQISLVNRYIVMCKLRQFSTIWGNVVGFSLFTFATIDRLLSTQRSNSKFEDEYTQSSYLLLAYRQWSNRLSLAYKMIFLIPFFWFVLLVHRIILYQIESNSCGPPPGIYTYYDNYFQVIFSSLAPAVVTSILAYLLIKSIREVSRRRILPVTTVVIPMNSNRTILQQMDVDLTRMLVIESLIAIITYVPYAIELSYMNITEHWSKTSVRLAWEKMCTELIHLLSYVFFATSFYVSMFSNLGFRRKIKRILRMKKSRPSQQMTTNRA